MRAKLDAGIPIAERRFGIRVQQHATFALADMTMPHGLGAGCDDDRAIADEAGVKTVLSVRIFRQHHVALVVLQPRDERLAAFDRVIVVRAP